MSKKIKYLSCCYKMSDSMKSALKEVPRRGGYYNWIFVHQGGIKPYRMVEDFEDYDVVSVNMSPIDQHLVPMIREKIPESSSILLVLNNDYVTECWPDWQQHPMEYLNVQKAGDAVFATEKYQTSFMRDDAYCMPHPHWIEGYKHIKPDYDNDDFDVAAIYHWWEGGSYHMSQILERLRKEFPKLYTKLYAYMQARDKSAKWQKVMFDEHKPMMEYKDYINSLGKNRFVFENGPYHTYGRNSVDTAAMGIPTVGSNRIDSMRRCWGQTAHDPYDARSILNSMRKILTDKNFVQDILDKAKEESEYYNYQNSRERYMTMIEETRQKLGK